MRETAGTNIYWLPGRVAGEPDRIVSPDQLVLDLDDRLHEELEARANEEEKTPDRLAKDLLDDALEEPRPLWEATKNVGFAFSLLFTVALFIQAGGFSGSVTNVTMGIAAIAMVVFIIMFMATILNPVVDPAVERVREWWASRRD